MFFRLSLLARRATRLRTAGVRACPTAARTAGVRRCATAAVAPLARKKESFGSRRPLLFGLYTTSLKHSFADGFVQVALEGKDMESFDYKRNLLFFLFGIFVSYNNAIPALLVPRLLPHLKTWNQLSFGKKLKDTRGLRQAAINFCCEKFGTTPFLYFPSWYILSESMNSDAPSSRWVPDALSKYRGNMKSDLVACWKVWMPVGLLTYSVIPIHMRMPWMAGVGFLWTVFLSSWKGNDGAEASNLNATARYLQRIASADDLRHLLHGSEELVAAFEAEAGPAGHLRDKEALGRVLDAVHIHDDSLSENLFDLMDVDHDGAVTLQELAAVLFLLSSHDVSGHKAAHEAAAALATNTRKRILSWAVMDRNKDGRIRVEELTAGLTALLTAREAVVRSKFDERLENMALYTSFTAASAAGAVRMKSLARLGEGETHRRRRERQAELVAELAAMDAELAREITVELEGAIRTTTGDATWNEKERARMVRKCVEAEATWLARGVFSEADVDQDGTITHEEFDAWLASAAAVDRGASSSPFLLRFEELFLIFHDVGGLKPVKKKMGGGH